jgi:DMSO/TMAO reductase YedYZ molybdopterin-dependent catalytic subunit
MNRRTFLAGMAAAPTAAALLTGRAGAAAPAAPAEAALIVRQSSPANLEMPFATLDGFLTPTPRFYVRNHFPVPEIRESDWRLTIDGAVERPAELSLAELVKLAGQTRPVTMECAGNGRVFLVPRAKGVLWSLGAVGTAEWTGVPLAAVLRKAGLKDSAVEVVLEGADQGEVRDDPKTPGVIRYSRSLPVKKALADVLLAHRMNGEPLTAAHGFPLRAVVPGWYGMAAVKWLTRITAVERPFTGYYQTADYSYWERRDGLANQVPLAAGVVKSSIARPFAGETVPTGAEYRIHGAAWAGEEQIAKVEVSVDGGRTWADAKLLGEPVKHCWRLWELPWRPAAAGRAVVMSRATDAAGRTQPARHDPDRRSYMINFVLPVEVTVR